MSTVTSNIKAFGEKAEEIRQRTADSLESAADTVRGAGNESAEAITGFTGEAARKLHSTAAIVRNPCLQNRLLSGVRSGIRRHPVKSLALAAAFGLVAGFTCRK